VSFQGRASFDWARFQGGAGFSYAQFQRHAGFTYAQVQRHAGFYQARFQDSAAFFDARFQDRALFSKASFQGPAGFNKATFEDDVWFNSAHFEDPVGLVQVAIAGMLELDRIVFNHPVDLEVVARRLSCRWTATTSAPPRPRPLSHSATSAVTWCRSPTAAIALTSRAPCLPVLLRSAPGPAARKARP
jgi:Pentapeptide repeats (9 copies)